MRERNFSKNIFSNSGAGASSGFLYQDKPDFSKIDQFMEDYENQHLATLSNIQWFLYPFLKTARVLLRKVGCCRDRDLVKGTRVKDTSKKLD